MDAISCYIMIFRLYWTCQNMKERRHEFSKEQCEGFFAYSYLFWYRAISKHLVLGKNIRDYIK